MGISNITENITRSTALQHETCTTQFHQLLQNNQGNINNLGNKTSLWGGDWSFPGECKPAFLDDEMLSIQVFITFCSLMYIHDMQFLALWTATAAPTGSTPLTVASTKTNLVGPYSQLISVSQEAHGIRFTRCFYMIAHLYISSLRRCIMASKTLW